MVEQVERLAKQVAEGKDRVMVPSAADGWVLLSAPHLSGREQSLIAEAIDSGYVAPAGPMLRRFECAFSAYTGLPYAVAVDSGTAALHLALHFLGIEAGDEVWASSFTFIGSVGPAFHLGADLVFFDCDSASWTFDTGLLSEELAAAAKRNRLPKAVIPTDLYGQSCDLDAIVEACRVFGVPVVVDSAEAVGTRYKGRSAGNGASAAAFSFNGNKIITTSGGGILASHDEALITAARKLATQAREPAIYYEHVEVGYNFRMSNICAAIGCAQLNVIERRVERRRQIFDRYREHLKGLPGLSFMPECDFGDGLSRANRWLSVIVVDPDVFGVDVTAILMALQAQRIEARPVWKPMHLQPVFSSARMVGGSVCERFFERGLCLPSGSGLQDDEIDRVSEIVTEQYCH